ncbi:Ig-like domain-containing protein [Winogradskyella sp.]|jgi:hypothetical protein|uniref:Ig-like domain-containing protein n=1 Tax=Winogradskyella sp. TaxID=1883156 RepID=UPI0025EFDC39|nr:Ig-like domain-containing protein [Winogradskyella sp.]MCT4630730.1 Ig-like domain-containing protein [Winogradskyella sp.]
MKKKSSLFTFLLLLLVFNCIGEDVINDTVEAELRILNNIENLSVSESHQFNISFFNNVGEEEPITVSWTSSNTSVAVITQEGLLSGVSEGETTISVSAQYNNTLVENSTIVTIVDGEVINLPNEKSGNIVTTSSYALSGSFTLTEIENTENLLLSFSDDYNASTSLPGLYLYLTNNPNSIANAQSLGPVSVFNGSHTYTIDNTGINDFSYLLYWCEPFGVKVGGGTIND